VKKSVKTSKDLLKGCLIALDEILDVCSSFFLVMLGKIQYRHNCGFVKTTGNLLLCKKRTLLENSADGLYCSLSPYTWLLLPMK